MGLVAMTGSVTKATRSSEPAIELMVTGVIGLLLSLLFWSSFSPYRRRVGPTCPTSVWLKSAAWSVISPDSLATPGRGVLGWTSRLVRRGWGRAARDDDSEPPHRLQSGFLGDLVGESGSR